MMRFQTTLATGIAAFCVAPGLVQDQAELDALQIGLADTERSLAILQKLESRSEEDAANLPLLILAATEPAQESGSELDDRLGMLRQEVSLLRMQVDAIESDESGSDATGTPAHDPHGAGAGEMTRSSQPEAVPSISTGLDESLRLRMQSRVNPRQAIRKPAQKAKPVVPVEQAAPQPEHENGPAQPVEPAPKVAIDFDGYSADPLGQAQACYRAGRYADCLALLESQDGIQAKHLRSRSLTRLERYDEAIENLMSIIESAGDGYEGKRARTDLEFVKWKRDFAKKLPKVADRSKGN